MTAKQRNRSREDAKPLRERRRQAHERPWWRSRWLMGGIFGVVAAVAVGFFYFTSLQASPSLPSGADLASVQQAITHVDAAIFDTVGTGDLPNPVKVMNSTQTLGGADGKPQVLYIGAEYCSTCASQRWSLIAALSRFGEFKTLQPTKSASGESYSELPSFTFYRGQYDSPYLSFVSVETGDRNKRPLQRASQDQQSLMALYDRPGTIPFIAFSNRYYTAGSGYDMKLISDKGWSDVATALRDPTNPLTRALIGNANYLTAGICQLTQNQPGSVCESSAVSEISAKLPN
jgi:hypothetical protein